MTKTELLTTPSGILIISAKSGHINKTSRLEFLLDDSYWPAFATDRARSTTARWDAIGESLVKELESGRVWIRRNENDDGEKEDIVGDLELDTKNFLDWCLDREEELSLINQDARAQREHQQLRVELVDGKEIHGADRDKSDPYVVFSLNGNRVYKSETKKKTLLPVWNESFGVNITSPFGANFTLEVFDCNQIEQAKSLGFGAIDLSTFEPFAASEQMVSLASNKHDEKGEIRLRMLFTPQFIANSRKNTSTFSTAGRAMTQLGAMPLGAGRGVVSGVGTGISKFTKAILQRPGSIDERDDVDLTGRQAVQQARFRRLELQLERSSIKPYAQLRVGKERFETKHAGKTTSPEWDEQFTFANSGETRRSMSVVVFDHKTLGKDKALGDADIDLARHLQGSGIAAVDVFVGYRH